MKHLALVAAVMVALSSTGEAQHPDHVAAHPAPDPVGGWQPPRRGRRQLPQEHLAERGLNAGYILTKSLDHWQPHYDNIEWVGAERSFGSPDPSVPYVLLGSVAGGYHTPPASWVGVLPPSRDRCRNPVLEAAPVGSPSIREWTR